MRNIFPVSAVDAFFPMDGNDFVLYKPGGTSEGCSYQYTGSITKRFDIEWAFEFDSLTTMGYSWYVQCGERTSIDNQLRSGDDLMWAGHEGNNHFYRAYGTNQVTLNPGAVISCKISLLRSADDPEIGTFQPWSFNMTAREVNL